jgi:hypothetical protein
VSGPVGFCTSFQQDNPALSSCSGVAGYCIPEGSFLTVAATGPGSIHRSPSHSSYDVRAQTLLFWTHSIIARAHRHHHTDRRMLQTLKFTLDAMETEVRCSITSASFNAYFYKTLDAHTRPPLPKTLL